MLANAGPKGGAHGYTICLSVHKVVETEMDKFCRCLHEFNKKFMKAKSSLS